MTRLAISHHAPEGYEAVAALDGYVKRSLDPELLDVVKLRASQINGCAFCVDLHAIHLEQRGVPSRKIHAVSTWQETSFFSTAERAVLALTEQVTRISHGVDDEVWQDAAAVLSERELSDWVLAIGTINVLNRIGVATHLAPPPLGN